MHALRGINLQIAAGEIVGLVGESGSGKTTLARAVMGLVPEPGVIERGQVLFGGRNLALLDDTARRAVLGRELVMVIPNPRAELNPVLTVGRQISNVVLHHLGVGRREADRVALAMLRAVRIPDPERRFDAYPHELSGGMAQRVVIAIALVCSPRLVISDDATSGLDVTVQSQVLELLQTMVREKGAAALFITRDLAITAHFCTRIAIIYAGEIVEIATTRELLRASTASLQHHAARCVLAQSGVACALDPAAGITGRHVANGCVSPRAVCAGSRVACRKRHRLRPVAAGHDVRCHFPVEPAA